MRARPPRPRRYIASLPRYTPGAAAIRADGTPGYKLASNESPYPLPEQVVAAMAEATRGANRYPQGGADLIDQLARRHGLSPQAIALAGGSLTLLRDLVTAYAGHGAEVLLGWRSYEAYPILVQSTGARVVEVPLVNHALDLDGLAAAVGPRTRMVLLAQPNNPTGTAVDQQHLESFARALPQRCLLALDLAYCEFGPDPLGASATRLAQSLPNLVVLRTFSKAYALAGMRVGWCAAHPEVVATLGQVALPFTLTAVAQSAALAALEHEDLLLPAVAGTIRERQRVQSALQELGYETPLSQGNFVWLPLGPGSGPFADICVQVGISVRCFPGEGVRVTIGTPVENDGFLEAAATARSGGARLAAD